MADPTIVRERNRLMSREKQDSVFLSGQMENGQIVHVIDGLRPEIHGRVTAEYTTHDSPIQIVIGLEFDLQRISGCGLAVEGLAVGQPYRGSPPTSVLAFEDIGQPLVDSQDSTRLHRRHSQARLTKGNSGEWFPARPLVGIER